MNKMELIEAVAKARDTSKADAGEIVDLFFSVEGVLAKELKKGGSIAITGFGNFEVRKRAAREGRNPQTGAVIKIKASKVPAFRPGKGLKDLVNRGQVSSLSHDESDYGPPRWAARRRFSTRVCRAVEPFPSDCPPEFHPPGRRPDGDGS